jgi:hypothetical protein
MRLKKCERNVQSHVYRQFTWKSVDALRTRRSNTNCSFCIESGCTALATAVIPQEQETPTRVVCHFACVMTFTLSLPRKILYGRYEHKPEVSALTNDTITQRIDMNCHGYSLKKNLEQCFKHKL